MMNDNELGAAVRESVARIHSATPVAQIVSRGRAVRARRRIPGVAAALALVVCAGLAVTALARSGHSGLVASGRHREPVASSRQGRQPATVRLVAWTVAMKANGDVDVTIHQLRDPAGLQATLRADGVPVTVSFSGRLNLPQSCRPYSTTLSATKAVSEIHGDHLIIDPAALPSGTGLAIFDEPGAGLPVPSGNTPTLGKKPHTHPAVPGLLKELNGPFAIGLVHASQQCTG
jgi:hypothetical protein